MKKVSKIFVALLVVAVVATLCLGLVACNDDDGYSRTEGQIIRFSAPEGTPALAMLRLVTDNPTLDGTQMEYAVVSPQNIASEMATRNSDVVIMPINAGANLIRQGADYKLVSVAVEGSLYMVGNKSGSNTLTFDDIKGKKIACIGQAAVPGMVFRYVMAQNGIEVITEGEPGANQVFVQYVSDATVARTALVNGSVSLAVVGEPAATAFKSSLENVNAEMDMQRQYSLVNPQVNGDNYPQAGLFVRTALANDKKFMAALFDALDRSEDWVEDHPAEVSQFAKDNLYAAANFPAPSIPRCAIDCDDLDNDDKNEIIAFLKNVMPKDSAGNNIDWDGAKSKLF